MNLRNGCEALCRHTKITGNLGQVLRDEVRFVAHRKGAIEASVVVLGQTTDPAEEAMLEAGGKQ